jgi:hypothetical protein
LLDAAEETFDQIAVLVQNLIERSLDEAMASRRDDRLDVVGSEVFEDGIGVVGLVSAERVRMQILQQWQSLWAVAGFTAGEAESCERPETFNQGVNLGTQSAPGSSEGLVTVFLGAPAAC